MPEYDETPIGAEINKVEIEKTRRAGGSAPMSEEEGRLKIETAMKAITKVAVANVKRNFDYVKQQHERAKGTMKEMTKRLEKMQANNYVLDAYTIEEIRSGLDIIKLHAKAVTDDGAKMYEPMANYRNFKEGDAGKVCEDVSFMAKYIAIRTNTMTIGKKAVAMSDRIQEYVKRGEVIVKAAEKAYKKAANAGEEEERDTQKAVTEANDLVQTLRDYTSDAERLATQIASRHKSMGSLKKKMPLNGKDQKVVASFAQDIETLHKKLRGYNKTAKLVAKQFGGILGNYPRVVRSQKRDLDMLQLDLARKIEDGDRIRQLAQRDLKAMT